MANTSRPGRYAPVGHQQIASLSAAVGVTLPASASGRANCAIIQAETQNVRWLDSGTTPTSTLGQLLTAGSDVWYEGDLARLLFIEVAASAKLNISFYEDSRAGQ